MLPKTKKVGRAGVPGGQSVHRCKNYDAPTVILIFIKSRVGSIRPTISHRVVVVGHAGGVIPVRLPRTVPLRRYNLPVQARIPLCDIGEQGLAKRETEHPCTAIAGT